MSLVIHYLHISLTFYAFPFVNYKEILPYFLDQFEQNGKMKSAAKQIAELHGSKVVGAGCLRHITTD